MEEEPLQKFCECRTLVWDVPHKAYLPHSREVIICPTCGKDHSRKTNPDRTGVYPSPTELAIMDAREGERKALAEAQPKAKKSRGKK